MKAIRWLLKLVLVMITLPLILAVWLAKWFVVFLHHCSAWFFYLLGSVLLATAVLSYLLQQSQGHGTYKIGRRTDSEIGGDSSCGDYRF